MNATLRKAKILQASFLIAVFIYILMLYYVKSDNLLGQVFPSNDPTLNLLTMMFSFISIAVITVAYVLPKLMLKRSKQEAPRPEQVLSMQIVRCAFFEAIAIFGFILVLLGAPWEFGAPFFIVAVAGLLLTFPTGERWNRFLEMKR